MASNEERPVTLAVNGERWSLRSTLADSGPETPLPVSLRRTAREPTPDQALWTVIRKHADATEFEF